MKYTKKHVMQKIKLQNGAILYGIKNGNKMHTLFGVYRINKKDILFQGTIRETSFKEIKEQYYMVI